jgi:hypothetical protein
MKQLIQFYKKDTLQRIILTGIYLYLIIIFFIIIIN